VANPFLSFLLNVDLYLTICETLIPDETFHILANFAEGASWMVRINAS
jgi:hypothetical protein